jgi:ABC-type transport system involved in cytochrome c biogenesis permease subunit
MNLRSFSRVLAGAAISLIALASQAASERFDDRTFGTLPVTANGRVQPLDSYARNSLLQLREKTSAHTAPWADGFFIRIGQMLGRPKRTDVLGETPRTLKAAEWLMEMMFHPERANERPVFRIDHPDLKGLLQLPIEAPADESSDAKHFSWKQIAVHLETLDVEATRVKGLDASKHTPFDRAISQLWNAIGIYMRTQNTVQPQNAVDWEKQLNTYVSTAPDARKAVLAMQDGKEYDKDLAEKLVRDFQIFQTMAKMEPPLAIPTLPVAGNGTGVEWKRTGEALLEVARGVKAPEAVSAYARMSTAYRAGQVEAFNAALRDYRSWIAQNASSDLAKSDKEVRFNRLEPFYKATNLYVLGGLIAILAGLSVARFEKMRKIAFWVTAVALALHTAGLMYRMTLEGRPPVTNLYSSAVFIGWGSCCLGLLLERFWRNSVGILVSCVVGFGTLIIAHNLSLGGDTMEMMRAVLDTNFWLATHVVVVTLGYASTFVAGILGIVFILRGVLTKGLDSVSAAALYRMAYGIVCFGVLFSFVGTVLGGIWADQSWGRFWGWDAKENGALMIVLWNAVLLHARWGGLVKDRGFMAMTVFGNIVTAWSWFGVNMLGIGLHSYGFMAAAFQWLMGFIISQIAIMALAALPRSKWRSSSSSGKPEPDSPESGQAQAA